MGEHLAQVANGLFALAELEIFVGQTETAALALFMSSRRTK
jgi:hypothetical protein